MSGEYAKARVLCKMFFCIPSVEPRRKLGPPFGHKNIDLKIQLDSIHLSIDHLQITILLSTSKSRLRTSFGSLSQMFRYHVYKVGSRSRKRATLIVNKIHVKRYPRFGDGVDEKAFFSSS